MVLVVFDHGQQPLTALQRLFGFDLAAEPRLRGARVAFEHLDAVVAVLDRACDGPTGAASDEPCQGAAELAAA